MYNIMTSLSVCVMREHQTWSFNQSPCNNTLFLQQKHILYITTYTLSLSFSLSLTLSRSVNSSVRCTQRALSSPSLPLSSTLLTQQARSYQLSLYIISCHHPAESWWTNHMAPPVRSTNERQEHTSRGPMGVLSAALSLRLVNKEDLLE